MGTSRDEGREAQRAESHKEKVNAILKFAQAGVRHITIADALGVSEEYIQKVLSSTG